MTETTQDSARNRETAAYLASSGGTVISTRLLVSKETSGSLISGGTYTCPAIEGNGGAAHVAEGASLVGENITFSGNSTTKKGGALYNKSTADLSGTQITFSGNTANETGGALLSNGTTLFQALCVTFSGNCSGEGGALYHDGEMISFSGSRVTFSGNTAKTGGAINNFGTISFHSDEVTFSGNTARSGGAVYNAGTIDFSSSITLTTSSDDIFNNTYGTINWDISGGRDSYASLSGYQWLHNCGTLCITVGDEQETGDYLIASGNLKILSGKNSFTILCGEESAVVTVGGEEVRCGGRTYFLNCVDGSALILTVGTGEPIVVAEGETLTLSENVPGKVPSVEIFSGGRLNLTGGMTLEAKALRLEDGTLDASDASAKAASVVVVGGENTLSGVVKALGDDASATVADGSVLHLGRAQYEEFLSWNDFVSDGELFVSPSTGYDLTLSDIQALAKKETLRSVNFDENLNGIARLTFDGNDLSVGFNNAYGTAGNNAITLRNASSITLGSGGGFIDLGAGDNSLYVNNASELTLLSDLCNVSFIRTDDGKPDAYSSLQLGKVAFSGERAGKLILGICSQNSIGNLSGGEKDDSILLKAGASLSAGDISGVETVTLYAGDTDFEAQHVSGLETLRIGNSSRVMMASLVTTDGDDRIIVNADSEFSVAGLIDFSGGKDTLCIGSSAVVSLRATEESAASLAEFTIGEGATASLSSELIARGLALDADFGKNAKIIDLGSTEAGKGFLA